MADPPHARDVLDRGQWPEATASLRVTLAHGDRHRRRLVLLTDEGAPFLLDLREARHLRDGDGLRLDDGRIVRIVAAAEELHEITAADGEALLRIAWHLGNRHLPLAVLPGGAIRIRADHVIAEMVRALGGTVRPVEAPFDPEHGAYGASRGHGH